MRHVPKPAFTTVCLAPNVEKRAIVAAGRAADGEVFNETVYFAAGVEEDAANETILNTVQTQLDAGANPGLGLTALHVVLHEMLGAIYAYECACPLFPHVPSMTDCFNLHQAALGVFDDDASPKGSGGVYEELSKAQEQLTVLAAAVCCHAHAKLGHQCQLKRTSSTDISRTPWLQGRIRAGACAASGGQHCREKGNLALAGPACCPQERCKSQQPLRQSFSDHAFNLPHLIAESDVLPSLAALYLHHLHKANKDTVWIMQANQILVSNPAVELATVQPLLDAAGPALTSGLEAANAAASGAPDAAERVSALLATIQELGEHFLRCPPFNA